MRFVMFAAAAALIVAACNLVVGGVNDRFARAAPSRIVLSR